METDTAGNINNIQEQDTDFNSAIQQWRRGVNRQFI